MHDLREPHLTLIKRILGYVKGTLDVGLHIATTPPISITTYFDTDWAGCPDSRHSTSATASTSVTTSFLGPPSAR
ncbi:hypothetical protein DsansV1_C10g0101821 [Dioscorea sansibarensis]